MFRLPVLVLLCGAALPAPAAHAQGMAGGTAGATAGGNAEAGRDLSVKHCARCHVVGDANPHGGIDSTPSFRLLARRDDWRARFQTFYDRRPHPVFVRVPGEAAWSDLPSFVAPFDIDFAEIEDIVSFVETLVPK